MWLGGSGSQVLSLLLFFLFLLVFSWQQHTHQLIYGILLQQQAVLSAYTMSLLIRNPTLWQWDTLAPDSAPLTCNYSIVTKKWIAVDKQGRYQFPKDENEELSEEAVQSYSACMDAAGRLLLPGLMDSHIHVSMTGESIHFVDLKECYSIDQLVNALKNHISLHIDLNWIVGVNWDQVLLQYGGSY